MRVSGLLRAEAAAFVGWPVVGAVVMVAGAGLAAQWLVAGSGAVAAIAVATGILLLAGRHWKDLLFEKLAAQRTALGEVRALVGLQEPRFSGPLAWSGWCLPPSTLAEVLLTVEERDAGIVVECGSGVSTLHIAAALEARGTGRVIALEHDPGWAELMRRRIAREGLDHRATVIEAPLAEQEFCGEATRWYAPAEFPLAAEEEIDLLLVDGPPGVSAPLARLGAVPYFWPSLAEDAVIFLDDTRRPDERRILELWCRDFPLAAERRSNEHALARLERRAARPDSVGGGGA